MKVINENSIYDGFVVRGKLQTKEASAEQQQKAKETVEQATVTMSISKLGYTYAGELPTREEVNLAREQMMKGIDRKNVGMLTESYKSMADSIKENYTGDEYNRQMSILDKAYHEEAYYQARGQMAEGIDRMSVINGKGVGMLDESYKNMADSVKENYTGDEYDRQMGILDKAYHEEAVYLAREQMTEAIDRMSVINGKSVGMLAESYKSMADSVKENYTGDEYDRQMSILDEAYQQASEMLSREYTNRSRGSPEGTGCGI